METSYAITRAINTRAEVHAAADWYACRYGREVEKGNDLPDLMSSRAVNHINANLDQFSRLVRAAYDRRFPR